MARHVRTGDNVIVNSGSHKGKVGTIMRIITKEDRVIVKGINLRTKHLKPSRLNPQGGIVTREAAIHISNVSPVVDGRPSRVRFLTRPDGSKVRVAARGGLELGVLRSADAKKKHAPKPAGSARPAKLAKPVKAAKPVKSAKPAQAAKPAKTTKPAKK